MAVLKKTFLYVCWLSGFFHLARYLNKNKLLILCYHGYEIADESQFRPKLFIKKKTFQSRLDLISKYNFSVLPLTEALEKLSQNNLPSNTLAITIDDGFFSTYKIAFPLLSSFRYPATLYITTYYVQKETPIFRLVIQYMFWKTSVHTLNLIDLPWTTKNGGNIDLVKNNNRDGLMWECIEHGETQCSEIEREEIAYKLGQLLEIDYSTIKNQRKLSLLNSQEIRTLNENNIDIQLHTHRHNFPQDDEFSANNEIIENKNALQPLVTHPLIHFCYPSGVWNKKQWPWLENQGIKSATTCEPGLNDHKTNHFGLRRFLDGENISQIEFEAEISGFTEILRKLFGAVLGSAHK